MKIKNFVKGGSFMKNEHSDNNEKAENRRAGDKQDAKVEDAKAVKDGIGLDVKVGAESDANAEARPEAKHDDKKDLKIEQLNKKVAEYLGDLQRTRADFENYRKQVELQKTAAMNTAKLATVYKMLPLLDDIDRAVMTYEQLQPLKKSLEKSLKELGLKRIESNEGTEFNPDLHDAMIVEGDGEKEVIGETLRPGYYFDDAVLRPAMVKVKRIAN